MRWTCTIVFVTSCLGLTLLSGSLKAQQVFFEDDFEEYIDDLELEDVGEWGLVEVGTPNEVGSKWTIGNPGGRMNPPDPHGVLGFGQFLISDSDASGDTDGEGSEMSHDLWSPIIDTTGSDTVWLHFDCTAVLNNNGKCVFDVDVSTDEGETWTNVFRRVAPSRTVVEPVASFDNADGFFGRIDVDISAEAGNNDLVQIRWRQFEPDDDWWIAIDNVVLDDEPAPTGGEVNLLSEGFAAGIPDTWTIESEFNNAGTATWTGDDPGNRSLRRNGLSFSDDQFVARLDENFAIIDPQAGGAASTDETLLTPAVDCSLADRVWIHWKSETLLSEVATQRVLLSLDGGATFEEEPLFDYPSGAWGGAWGEDAIFAERVFEIPAAAGQSAVVVAFHYKGETNPRWWAIDDVKISGTGEGLAERNCPSQEFVVDRFDPAAGSIHMSWKGVSSDTGYRILRDGDDISGALGVGVREFTDSSPSAGTSVVYTLVADGPSELQCEATAVETFTCPVGLACCTDRASNQIALSWSAGVNLAGDGIEVLRNGASVGTVALDAEAFVDSEIPGPGRYEYSIAIAGGPEGQCPELDLSCQTVIVGAGFLYFEDFDCYATDAEVGAAGWRIVDENTPVENATWTVTNPGGRVNPPTEDGTPSQGRFLISDSDAAGGDNPTGSGMSHDLWSPEIDASGASSVWLHMDCSAQLNNNGKCVFDIDVSTDGAVSWQNAFRRVAPLRNDFEPLATNENADGFFGRLHVDLSDLAAGESFQFRLRHFEPNDDWWIAIDNVEVGTEPHEGGATVLLETESFEDEIGGDWFARNGAGEDSDLWTAEDLCFRYQEGFVAEQGINRLGSNFAIADSECEIVTVYDEYLVSPIVNCEEMTDVFLHFRSEVLASDAAIEEVLLSLDGGDSFQEAPIFSYAGGGLFDSEEEPYYAERIFAVPAAAGEAEVAFAFHYRGLAPGAASWGVTDVQVTGEGGPAQLGFRRGDPDDSGGGNITDAIAVLNHLFAGDPPPKCFEASDVNDDGAVNIADPVYHLNFLFGGGPPPGEPGPDDCGEDPDPAGSLGCQEYSSC